MSPRSTIEGSGPGSGFEADQFSLGEVEPFGQMVRGAREPGVLRRAARCNLVTKLMVVLLGLMALMVVVVLAGSRISRL